MASLLHPPLMVPARSPRRVVVVVYSLSLSVTFCAAFSKQLALIYLSGGGSELQGVTFSKVFLQPLSHIMQFFMSVPNQVTPGNMRA